MDTYNNLFDPTPNLNPSPIPVLFIPFDNDENKCNYCGNEHSKTLKFEQNYCKNCLSWYNRYTTGNNACLDIYITNNVKCTEHEITRNGFDPTNIQEWCEYCSEVSYFKQVIPNTSSFNNHYLSRNCTHNNHSKTTCQLCEIMLQSFNYSPDYYQISSGWVELSLTKKSIPILYLPWWDIYDQCVVCSQKLEYVHQKSELNIELYCQKWCSHCFTIYTGCRYCLTINIIFGITNQTQCIKCKKISPINIDITNIISGNCIIDEFIVSTKLNYNNFQPIANYIDNNTNLNPLNIYVFIRNMLYLISKLDE
ncbi:uncharacterized protein OCT59_000148 [Rhizophagus irregularis]|uniref:uncharacterized protein n=1 Tax=Rhizophagus irregularis TaxID=588596 RepID=UPI000CB4964A|nr:hypothetical protein OCT59_000148 [Rhizophagus irregularis]